MSAHQFKRGDTVVVTGAAQGFGRAISLRLARDGARLILWDIAADGLNETAAQCRALGTEAVTERVDMSDRHSVEAAAKKAVSGGLFGLVNNAAIFPRSTVLDMDPEQWDRVIRTNLTGPFLAAKFLAPAMVAAKRGSIISMASTLAHRGDPVGAHYSASKGGIISMTRSLALAFAPDGIRVNCILPGIADTAQPLGGMTHEELVARGALIPLGRIAQPEDIIGTVSFLMSDDAAYITGQAISVNGGAIP